MSRQAPTSHAILESHPKVRYFRETAPYASETGPPRPPCSCRLQTVPQPVGFDGDVQSPCRRPKFGRPLQPVDSGDWAGVVCLWRRVPLFDEFADALAAEFQEIRYTLHATRARSTGICRRPSPGLRRALLPGAAAPRSKRRRRVAAPASGSGSADCAKDPWASGKRPAHTSSSPLS